MRNFFIAYHFPGANIGAQRKLCIIPQPASSNKKIGVIFISILHKCFRKRQHERMLQYLNDYFEKFYDFNIKNSQNVSSNAIILNCKPVEE